MFSLPAFLRLQGGMALSCLGWVVFGWAGWLGRGFKFFWGWWGGYDGMVW